MVKEHPALKTGLIVGIVNRDGTGEQTNAKKN